MCYKPAVIMVINNQKVRDTNYLKKPSKTTDGSPYLLDGNSRKFAYILNMNVFSCHFSLNKTIQQLLIFIYNILDAAENHYLVILYQRLKHGWVLC